MAFKFETSDATVEEAVRRLAADQLDGAIAGLEENGGDRAKAIHNARKSAKRLRGLLRLVQPVFPDHKRENAAIRDAAATLSALRDAEVAGETFAKVASTLGDRLSDTQRAEFEKALSERTSRLGEEHDGEKTQAQAVEALRAIRDRSVDWRIEKNGFKALGRGFRETYRRARRDLKLAERGADVETFHDWRKQVKYHFMHLCLLRDISPSMLDGQRKLANDLGETLGDHHDVAVFETMIENESERFAGLDGLSTLRDGLRERREALEKEALTLGRQLFGERARSLRQRVETYWTAWRETA